MSPHAPPKPDTDWSKRPVGEVIDHIVERYHASLRAQLGEVTRFAEAIRLSDLVRRPTLVSQLLEKLQILAEELTQHMVKEERLAFQMVRAAGGFVGVPLAVMEHEHRLARELLDDLRALTDDWTAPTGTSAALRGLYVLMVELGRDLLVHSALEDDLFARARADAHPAHPKVANTL